MSKLDEARSNPFHGLIDSLARVERGPAWDELEEKERQQAASAYAGENEKHFTDYVQDCIKTSLAAKRDVRQMQEECYRVYKEKEPGSYARKAAWQSRIVVPKPYTTVQFASSAVRKAFSPDFLSIEDPQQKDAASFWQKMMTRQMDSAHANFIINFVDATTMALAVGESMEIKPRFQPGTGLRFTMAEPWKILRDPDATPRDPQSGVYWIHQEWQDYFRLKQAEKAGRYHNIDSTIAVGAADQDNPFMTKEAIEARKDQIWQRSRFRKMVQVSEFWGTVLSPNGELLLERANMTLAGGRMISDPGGVRYRSLRWPGTMFSPQPDLLTLGGRGLLEGVRSIWEAMCNLMCLHEDAMKWLVNPMTEINIDALSNPEDVRIHPGKKFLTQDSLNGQQAVRTVTRRDVTGSVLANMQYHDQNYQRGSSVSDGVQGLPGYRKDMTARESAQNLGQAMEVFNLMGVNLELGAIQALSAAQEVVETYAGLQDYQQVFTDAELQAYGISVNNDGRLVGVPKMSGSFHVSGIQKLLKDNETMGVLISTVIPMSENPIWRPYIRPYQVVKALELRSGLKDENIFVPEELGEQLESAQLQAILAPPPEEEGGGVDDNGDQPENGAPPGGA